MKTYQKSRNGLTIMKKRKKPSVNQGGCEYFVQPFCTLSSPMDYEKKIDGNLCQPLGSNFMIMIKIRPLVYTNIICGVSSSKIQD